MEPLSNLPFLISRFACKITNKWPTIFTYPLIPKVCLEKEIFVKIVDNNKYDDFY